MSGRLGWDHRIRVTLRHHTPRFVGGFLIEGFSAPCVFFGAFSARTCSASRSALDRDRLNAKRFGLC